MSTQGSLRAHIGALAAAAIAIGALATATTAHADSWQDKVGAAKLVSPHQGPGVGSVKSPPFYDAAYLNQQAQTHGDMVFHTRDNQPAYRAQQHQGPGLWSPKAPGIR